MRVAILGGSGRMGSWFARYFRMKGCDVILWARNIERLANVARSIGVSYASDAAAAVRDADIVMVSVPVSAVVETVRMVSPFVRRNALLFDVASVKGEIPDVIGREGLKHGYRAVSLHPMFGPGARGIEGQRVIVIPLKGHEEAARWLADYFARDGAKVIFSDKETHDRMVALTLALPHFLNIAFTAYLADTGEEVERLMEFSGTTFSIQLILSESVLQENPLVYADIQMENEEFKKTVKGVTCVIQQLCNVILEKDKEMFIEVFGKARRWTAKDAQKRQAYEKLYKIFEGAIS
ncbi:MAG: prephenate dehydrogenase/arogenate dehydrogenase family protein [Candidatus Freyarchaeota archaeon]